MVIGIQLCDGAATIKDNYIHDLADTEPNPHFDGITVLGGQDGVLIEHNTIACPMAVARPTSSSRLSLAQSTM